MHEIIDISAIKGRKNNENNTSSDPKKVTPLFENL
jgi:hypothetical protein